ncbi:MAG: hypothetical protein CW341_06280, partial [Bacteroidetes bacterium]|nr:hypothetical protein [Bacteroidota bacterium]
GSWCIITLGDSRDILIENNTIVIGNDGARAIACHSKKSIIRNNRISSSKQGSTDNAILVASYVLNTCRVYKNKYLSK